jgi:hypothetical protein
MDHFVCDGGGTLTLDASSTWGRSSSVEGCSGRSMRCGSESITRACRASVAKGVRQDRKGRPRAVALQYCYTYHPILYARYNMMLP